MARADKATRTAAKLLDAHVAFEVRRILDADDFERTVTDEVDHFLALADRLTLGEAISAEPVKAVAQKYAVQIPVEGAIPELVGEIARSLYRNSVGGEYRLVDIVDDRHFDELATGVSELGVTGRVLRRVLEGPAAVDTAVEVVSRAVDSVLDDPAAADEATDVLGWLRDRGAWGLRTAAKPIRPVIDTAVEQATRAGASFVLHSTEDDADEMLLDSVREVWRTHKDESLAAYRDLVTEDDVDDIVVLVFEFWREFRNTEFLRTLIDESIDYVFAKYGDTPLSELLAEVGVHREDLLEEAMRFGPPVLERLHETGFLEAVVRRRLAAFYGSADFRAALKG
ncbi:MAG: hypothetical protein QM728_07625 [Gordonia sp. (in: high G+C Gram-positive bacteria)]|uniref:hypothetical protein n=1 Tax=Gordonia sp. (in: high G+C Gram-positive bacteria) TaxID=84139 RepID=UPI0039E4067E